ncbi:hypothetical protein ABID08_006535 [Rhizobium binae]|uniref:Uncharacterized protein n=1 Tax=Rhizobium binae TaxID=1138190 RepID=A0ABV2MRQ5_9HYPH|nr:hypothetical protein [Rhizobium binae]MBX4993845.1 hypothetical protein [Rhizobium binae]NKL52105.1 hypothetical protein [Rhizobium leguminosarum bv. viciae]QSY83277.1 hypothetical protein J2J99_05535 [Rhizobium binae]
MSVDEAQVTKSQVGADLDREAREHAGAVSGKAAGGFEIDDLQVDLLSWLSVPPTVAGRVLGFVFGVS